MIGLLQRVSSASVAVAGEQIAAIDAGLLVFVGVQRDDSEAGAQRLLDRIVKRLAVLAVHDEDVEMYILVYG